MLCSVLEKLDFTGNRKEARCAVFLLLKHRCGVDNNIVDVHDRNERIAVNTGDES